MEFLLIASFGILLVVPQCFLILSRYLRRKSYSAVNKLAYPSTEKASWVWGHELLIFRRPVCEMYLKWASALGPIYRIKAALFQPDIIIVIDIAAIQHIFQNAYTYVKAPAFRPLVARTLGKGIVWAEGDEHKHQRRMLAPAFTTNAVKGMADDIFGCAEKLCSRLKAQIILQQCTKTTLNIVPFTSACTLDMIGRIAFNHDFGAGESAEAKEISASWHQDVVSLHTSAGFLAPILLNILPWIAELPIPAIQAEGVSKRIARRLGGELLKNANTDSHAQGNDILSLLIQDNMKDNELRLTDNQLLDNIATLILVGHETTASSMNFTLLQLARNPLIQRKLREEIKSAGDHLDYNNIIELEYLDAVAREGLRLHPAAPRTERVALQDDTIPLRKPLRTSDGQLITSLPIKAGQVFYIPFKGPNVDPDVWGPDAEEFKPERWLTPGGIPDPSQLPRGPWAGISTFCDGPRSCIGWRLGLLELKVMIALLVLSFELEATRAEIKEYMSPTLQPFVNDEAGVLPLTISVVPEA